MLARRPVRTLRCLIVAAAACIPMLCAGAPRPWVEAPFSIYAGNEPLSDVLQKFAANFSLRTEVDPALTGLVNGKFNTTSPTEFMNKLGGAYGFDWFVHAGTLFVSRSSASVTKAISVGNAGEGARAGAVQKALADLGVLDERFGWGELPERGLALVSGPPQYVKMIEDTLAVLPVTAQGGQQVMVFRLKHASVDDRTIIYRDREISTPGVVSVLRGLLGAADADEVRVDGPAGATMGVARPASSTANASASAPGAEAAQSPATGSSGGRAVRSAANRGRGPSIQADPRLNAVIVKDTPERMPIYERLIAQLDTATPLIEIEALIIDVNSQRLDELGIAWNAVARSGGVALGYGDITTPVDGSTVSAVVAPRGAGATPATTALAGAAGYLIARLRLLEQNGDARIQARPSILTMDNVGALIDLSETFYIQTTGERVATVTPVTVGTTLRVTPRLVTQGGQEVVRLVVDIEDGQIEDRVVAALPTVRRSTVSTQAVVRKDEGLLLGGYKTEQNISTRSKVPFLGDVPGIGLLFSSKSQDVQRRERLFLIRPKIVGIPDASGAIRYMQPPVEVPAPIVPDNPAAQNSSAS